LRKTIILSLLIYPLLLGCTMGIVRQEELSPAAPAAASTPSVTPQPAATPETPSTSTPTETPVPSIMPTTTPTLAPSPTERPDSGPVILYFRANVEEADPGDTIVLEWESVGATKAIIYQIPPSYQMPQSGWDVDTSGTLSHQIGLHERNWIMFQLYVFDAAERSASASLTVSLRCPDPWFFSPAPDVCPTSPIVSAAAEQHFERGTMVWIEELDRIYVLFADDVHSPKWLGFEDKWDESMPDRDPTLVPPDGLYQPIRGFGLVWRQNSTVRERLGWATDQETAFETIVQHTTLYKYNSTYLRALDGDVWHLGPEMSSWEKIAVE
jgi:hypothetical protein